MIPILKYLTWFYCSFSTVSTVYSLSYTIQAASRSLLSNSEFDTHPPVSYSLNICAGLQVFRIILIISMQMWRALNCNMRTQSCNRRKLDASSNRPNFYKWIAFPLPRYCLCALRLCGVAISPCFYSRNYLSLLLD